MPSPSLVLAYSLQVAAVTALVAATLALVARRAPRVRLLSWRAVLATALLLPLAALLPARTTPHALGMVTGAVSGAIAALPATTAAPTKTGADIDWAFWFTSALIAGAVVRMARMALIWSRLRRLRRHLPATDCSLFEELRGELGVEARLAWREDVAQPFTFGHHPAVVVVPADLAAAPPAALRGIFIHELTHVARRDWRWLVAEEGVGALLWFHPAIGFALRELGQAREELVDRATVAMTGARRAYLETLVALASRAAPVHGLSLSIFGSRQLPRRIAALATEASMSRLTVYASSMIVVLAGATAVTAAVRTFPLAHAEQAVAGDAGPLEKQAYIAPRDAAPPARIHYVPPALPSDTKSREPFEVEMRLVVDANGHVAEARSLKSTATSAAATNAVVSAARQWRFEKPEMAPLALTTTMMFSASGEASTGYSSRERPMPIEIKAAAYPDDAMKAKVEGEVRAEVSIDKDGRVSDVQIVRAPMPSMAEATVTALKASTFRPGMKDGTPVPVQVTMTVRFKLQ